MTVDEVADALRSLFDTLEMCHSNAKSAMGIIPNLVEARKAAEVGKEAIEKIAELMLVALHQHGSEAPATIKSHVNDRYAQFDAMIAEITILERIAEDASSRGYATAGANASN